MYAASDIHELYYNFMLKIQTGGVSCHDYGQMSWARRSETAKHPEYHIRDIRQPTVFCEYDT